MLQDDRQDFTKADYFVRLYRFVLWERLENSKASTSTDTGARETLLPARDLEDDDAAEGRPASNAPKGAVSDLTRSTEEPPAKRQKGQNKGRTFARIYEEGQRLCHSTNRGEPCARQLSGLSCDLNHDIKAYLESQKKDVILATEHNPDIIKDCPVSICRSSAPTEEWARQLLSYSPHTAARGFRCLPIRLQVPLLYHPCSSHGRRDRISR